MKDDGPGIKPALLENIFIPFYSGVEGKCKSESSGHGLAISKGIVDELGGEIIVNSEIGKGTVVTVDLSLSLTNKRECCQDMIEQNYQSIEGMKILIVEKEPLYILVARRLLEKKGAAIYLAENDQAALELFENCKTEVFDCVLIDIGIQGIAGIETAKKVRQSKNTVGKEIPIIGFGEELTQEEKHYCIEAGINNFLKKPLKFKELFQILLDLEKRG